MGSFSILNSCVHDDLMSGHVILVDRQGPLLGIVQIEWIDGQLVDQALIVLHELDVALLAGEPDPWGRFFR